MDSTLKFTGVDKTALKLTAGRGVNLVIASAIQQLNDDGNVDYVPMFATIKGTIKSHKLSPITRQGKLEPEIDINLSYYKLEINNVNLYEIDQANAVCMIDGNDLMAGVKSIIG